MTINHDERIRWQVQWYFVLQTVRQFGHKYVLSRTEQSILARLPLTVTPIKNVHKPICILANRTRWTRIIFKVALFITLFNFVKTWTFNNRSQYHCVHVRIQRRSSGRLLAFRKRRELWPSVQIQRDVGRSYCPGHDIHNHVLQLHFVHRVALYVSHLSQHNFYLEFKKNTHVVGVTIGISVYQCDEVIKYGNFPRIS